MKLLFSDRLWIVKAAASLGLFAWFCTLAQKEFSSLYPDAERSAGAFRSVEGKTAMLWACRVEKTAPDSFEVGSPVGPLRILSTAAPPEGARVSIVGQITAPRTITAQTLQINEGYSWKRPLNYGISVLTVILFLAAIRSRFRLNLRDGVFRSRY